MDSIADLQYESFGAGNDFIGLQDKLVDPSVKSIANGFQESFTRLTYMHGLPLIISYLSGAAAAATKGEVLSCFMVAKRQPVTTQHFIVVSAAMKASGLVPGDANSLDVHTFGCMFMKYAQFVLSTASYEQNFVAHGIESLFSAILSGCYSAFEAMASDLWVAAVNHNSTLAKNFLAKNQDKSVNLATLAGYDFDVKHSMGKILKENSRVSFASLNNVRAAYKEAFKTETEPIFESNQDIVLAEKIRHLIAHRGGIVDEEFKGEAGEACPFGEINIGSHLSMTGPLLTRFADACTRTGVQLLMFVDGKMTANVA